MRAPANSAPRPEKQEWHIEQHPVQLAQMRQLEPTGKAIMKPSLDLIKNIYTQVIRHSLSQPEEIDQILMKMAAEDLAQNSPIENVTKLVQTARDVEHGSFPTADGFSYGVAHKRSAHRLPDHYLFFTPRTY